jgi:hypothetical protein
VIVAVQLAHGAGERATHRHRCAVPPPPQVPPLSLALRLDLNDLTLSLEPVWGGTTMDVRIETFPDRLAVCARHVGPCTQVGETFRRVFAWAGPAGVLRPGVAIMGLSYDNPETHAPEELRYDVCFSVGSPVGGLPEGFRLDTVGGGRYAVHTCRRRRWSLSLRKAS